MMAKQSWILVLMLLFVPILLCDKSFAIEQHRFHSETNGYSVTIPKGWRQVPEKVVRQAFGAAISENKLTLNIETVLAIDFDETDLKHPYAIIYIKRYSKYGVNRALTKKEVKEIFKKTVGELRLQATAVKNFDDYLSESMQGMLSRMELGKVYLDEENMSYLFGVDMETASLGKVKSLSFGAFGRHALVKIHFSCLDSDWHRLKNDRTQILHSFQFDPVTDYKGAKKKNNSFWEDSLVDFGVYGIVALIIVLIGFVGRLCKSNVNNKPNDEQKE
ncbi:MAG: hypothetical protein FVQ80_12515 [Planctomycetes bacterium]|nr:hypothetical protein [Planctomycetota bacterium]